MPWYVVVTRPRAELKVKDRLKAIGVEVCCPTRVEKRQWSDRVKKVEVPLLPSMVLVFLEVKDRELIFSVPGIVRYLFYLGKPAVVPKKEVELLNDIEKKGTNIIAIKAIKAGDIIDVPGFGATAQKGKVRHISGNKCWVVLERLGFVVTLQLE
ncbi:UpxY family transcription antiterminator [Flavobacteriaceae bacterium]|nr:UpxY family transcription antiterminator [Flavobacteriaceae bacterium]